jgi:BirA family biotin operon repressor/biotin-[acetyl-CoA-carboxylase] ligase
LSFLPLRVFHLESVPSTQDVALGMVVEGSREWDAVQADEQTAGRGRREADWFSPKGQCLAISYILWEVPVPERPWALGMAMAVAVADAIALELETGRVALRWPNDVLAGDADLRKIAGLLVETAGTPDGREVAVVGVGVNCRVTAFPEELRGIAVSLSDLTGRAHDPHRLATAIWSLFQQGPKGLGEVVEAFRRRDATAGKRFRAPDGRAGTALGFSETGLLRVRWDDGTEAELPAAQAI